MTSQAVRMIRKTRDTSPGHTPPTTTRDTGRDTPGTHRARAVHNPRSEGGTHVGILQNPHQPDGAGHLCPTLWVELCPGQLFTGGTA
jgi:hypothetical protein